MMSESRYQRTCDHFSGYILEKIRLGPQSHENMTVVASKVPGKHPRHSLESSAKEVQVPFMEFKSESVTCRTSYSGP